MLDIVFRSCDHTIVHPERGSRFIDVDKTTLIKKCYVSLLNSISLAENDIKLWVVDDHSSTDLLKYFKYKANEKNISVQITSLEEEGYNYSALKQFELCKNIGREWVYSVEDDYLHYPECIKVLVKEAEHFTQMMGRLVALRPDDDFFTYAGNTEYSKKPCRLVLGSDRHWRTLYNTHNTFFTHVDILKEYWELFASLAKFFHRTTVSEDGTINTIWSDGVSKAGPVPLFSPIPTLSIHISQGNEPYWIDYKQLWDSVVI